MNNNINIQEKLQDILAQEFGKYNNIDVQKTLEYILTQELSKSLKRHIRSEKINHILNNIKNTEK